MEGNYIAYFNSIIDHISRYQDHCYTCANYRHGLCGFVYPAQRFVGGATILLETYKQMSYDERVLYDTRASGDPCEDQEGSVSFLNSIEDDLSRMPEGIDEGTLTHVLRRLYRVLGKHNISDPLMANTSIRSDVFKAVQLILAKFDLDALEHGISILRLIKTTKLGYTRKGGLYLLCPEEMAIPLIRKSIVQTADGYYLGNGEYEKDDEDVIIKLNHFLGKDRDQALSSLVTNKTVEADTLTFVADDDDKPHGAQALDRCLEMIASTDTMLFLLAFDLCLGIRPQRPYVAVGSKDFDSFIDRYIVPKSGFVIEFFDEVTLALSHEIGLRKNDEHALAVYLSGILSQFDGITRMLFPQDGTRLAAATPEIYRLSFFFSNCPVRDYAKMAKIALSNVDGDLEPGTDEFNDEFDSIITNMAYVESKSANELVAIRNLIDAYNNFESALEGALLINGIGHDYLYYESQCNIRLYGGATLEGVSSVTNLTVSAIRNFAIELNHQCFQDEYAFHLDARDGRDEQDEQPPVIDNSPINRYPDLKKYLDALRDDNYLDASFHWIRKGHTNYHAGWAAKIMLANVEGLRYEDISNIIGVSNLADHASKCFTHNKISKQQDIEFCFSSHNLSTTRS